MHFCKIAGRLFCFLAFVRDFSVYRHFLRIFKQTNKIVEKNLWRNAMNIYESIKAAISVKQAAEHYGLKANRNGMACCPFHNDRHPSLKLNEDYFFCFGCGAKGDVIDFVARLFNLSNYEAAQRLAADFGICSEPGQPVVAPHKPKHPHIRQFRKNEMLCFRVLTDYLHLLEDWKVRYAPKTPDDALDDRFVEALQMY